MVPRSDHQRRRQTIQTASRTIDFDILLVPSVRSTKTMGISAIRKFRFHARKLISIWNAYPLDRTRLRSIASRTDLRKHLKPPVASHTGRPVMALAYMLAQ